MKVKSESEVTQSVSDSATPWTAACQAPPSMGFSRQNSTGVGCHCLSEGPKITQREILITLFGMLSNMGNVVK